MTPIFYESVIIKFLLGNPEIRDRIFPYLDPKIFSDFGHVSIINAFIKFHHDFKKFPTSSDLKLVLKEKETFDALARIINIDLSEHTHEAILQQVEFFFRSKLLINEAFEIVEGVKSENLTDIKDCPDRLREAMAFTFDSDCGTDLFDDMDDFYSWLHSPNRVISSGLSTLDQFIEGGFAKETLSVFMGESNIGKSITLAGLAVNCLLQKNNVLYLTLEMSDFKTMRRMYANLFDIDINEMKLVPKSVLLAKKEEMEKTLDKKLVLQKYPTGTMTADHMRNLLKELKIKKNFIPDIIFIDYLGIMRPIKAKKEGNMYHDVKSICEEVRAVAVENDVPIVSVAQISKGGYSSAEIELKDVAESMGLVHTCDVIVGITQSDELRAAGKFTFSVLKNRDGMNKQKIYVNINYPYMRISEPEEDTGEGLEHAISEPIVSVAPKLRKTTSIGLVDQASVDMLKTKTNIQPVVDTEKKFIDFE